MGLNSKEAFPEVHGDGWNLLQTGKQLEGAGSQNKLEGREGRLEDVLTSRELCSEICISFLQSHGVVVSREEICIKLEPCCDCM